MKIEFLPAAADELVEAADGYEIAVPGLGAELILEVRRIARLVLELPLLGEKLDQRHRRVPLRRFPYGLIFRCDGDTIRVVAIAHQRRRPRYWAGRVQDR